MTFLFFDTETNAVGRMTHPVTQTLMQLAWVVTDSSGVVLRFQNRFVRGASRVGRYAPHGLTPEYVEEHGDEPGVVLDEFIKDAHNVVSNGGKLVAHNADFDIGVLEHAGADMTLLKKEVMCTISRSQSSCIFLSILGPAMTSSFTRYLKN